MTIGCSDGGDNNDSADNNDAEGIITVVISNAEAFNNGMFVYSIWDYIPAEGPPTGNMIAVGKPFIIKNGSGSSITYDLYTENPHEFSNGTYYIGGVVDMNGNYSETQPMDSGDYTLIYEIVVDGNTTVNLTESDFDIYE